MSTCELHRQQLAARASSPLVRFFADPRELRVSVRAEAFHGRTLYSVRITERATGRSVAASSYAPSAALGQALTAAARAGLAVDLDLARAVAHPWQSTGALEIDCIDRA